ncbi:MAG: hypothetical protein L0322_31905 [Chloroflexi bacterium]|nr:hypothetical protein [Chloroflexota bacterium]MCI0646715.1 hypothetical protein [Chloroflexota bacterium]
MSWIAVITGALAGFGSLSSAILTTILGSALAGVVAGLAPFFIVATLAVGAAGLLLWAFSSLMREVADAITQASSEGSGPVTLSVMVGDGGVTGVLIEGNGYSRTVWFDPLTSLLLFATFLDWMLRVQTLSDVYIDAREFGTWLIDVPGV